MDPLTNIRNLSKKAKIVNTEDRISSLPDPILVHILSFLPTKWGISTTILSTRWKNLWASVPIFVFYSLSDKDPELTGRFMNFVDRALLLHDLPRITKFDIKCSKMIDMSRLNAWISLLIKRHIQELEIYVSTCKFVKFPINLFTCKSLVKLKLEPFLRLDIPSTISFPSLKTLHISLVLPNNHLTERLFSSCPVLQNLCIEGHVCNFDLMEFNISSPVLKKLEIHLFTSVSENFASRIVLSAPVLEYLDIRDNILCIYELSNLSSLVEVNLDVGDFYMVREGVIDRLRLLVKEITTVNKVLALGVNTMAALSNADDFVWPTFRNLTCLELSISDLFDWKGMPNLLASVPNIALLILRMERVEPCDDDLHFESLDWIQLQERPACLLLHLKEIRVFGFEGSKDEVELIKFLLHDAEVLEKMMIFKGSGLCLEGENEFLKKLLMLPRGSKATQIHFV